MLSLILLFSSGVQLHGCFGAGEGENNKQIDTRTEEELACIGRGAGDERRWMDVVALLQKHCNVMCAGVEMIFMH